MDREPVFSIKGLTKAYRMGEAEVHALRGVDLDLYSSELVVLLGPSGSGKSTLLNIMGGLDNISPHMYIESFDEPLGFFIGGGQACGLPASGGLHLLGHVRGHVVFDLRDGILANSLLAEAKDRVDRLLCLVRVYPELGAYLREELFYRYVHRPCLVAPQSLKCKGLGPRPRDV